MNSSFNFWNRLLMQFSFCSLVTSTIGAPPSKLKKPASLGGTTSSPILLEYVKASWFSLPGLSQFDDLLFVPTMTDWYPCSVARRSASRHTNSSDTNGSETSIYFVDLLHKTWLVWSLATKPFLGESVSLLFYCTILLLCWFFFSHKTVGRPLLCHFPFYKIENNYNLLEFISE